MNFILFLKKFLGFARAAEAEEVQKMSKNSPESE